MKKVSTSRPTKRLKEENTTGKEPSKKTLDLILQFAGAYSAPEIKSGERLNFFIN